MLNNITIMGRLTRDPEVRTTQTGTSVASFSLAVERDFKDPSGQRPVDFLDVVAWRGTADLAGQFLTKGRMVVVTGRLETRRWQDKNGNNRISYEIICNSFYFADSGNQNAQQGPQNQHYTQQGFAQQGYPERPPAQNGFAAAQQKLNQLGTEVPFDEEVPF
nr:MAG TPA: Single strand binding protein [Caudoviricetes sp.]